MIVNKKPSGTRRSYWIRLRNSGWRATIGIVIGIVGMTLFLAQCTPSPGVAPATPATPPESVTFSSTPRAEYRIIDREEISQNNCGGKKDFQESISRSHTIERNIGVGMEIGASAGGSAKVFGTGIDLEARLTSHLNSNYGTSETQQRTIELGAPPGTHMIHTIVKYEVWGIGVAELEIAGRQEHIPFRFRHDFALQLEDSKDIGCPTQTVTQTLEVETTNTNTPTPIDTATDDLQPDTTTETPTSTASMTSTSTPEQTSTPTSTPSPLPTATVTTIPQPLKVYPLTPTILLGQYLEIEGEGQPGSTIELADGATALGNSVIVNAQGQWSIPIRLGTLGVHTIQVSQSSNQIQTGAVFVMIEVVEPTSTPTETQTSTATATNTPIPIFTPTTIPTTTDPPIPTFTPIKSSTSTNTPRSIPAATSVPPTVTPTIGYTSVQLLSPANKATFSTGQTVTLRWSEVASLIPGDHYLVVLKHNPKDWYNWFVTDETSWDVTKDWTQPTDGFQWYVAICRGADLGGADKNPCTPQPFAQSEMRTFLRPDSAGGSNSDRSSTPEPTPCTPTTC